MRPAIHAAALALIAALLAGCASAGKTYATQHPELLPAHRQILQRGEIPSGDAVAGMTREQVRLAMGADPTTYDEIDGLTAWIFTSKHGVGRETPDDFAYTGGSQSRDMESFTQTQDFSPRHDVVRKTTVLFDGDRAARATVTEESR